MNEPEIKNFIKVPCESCGNERFVTVCDRKDGFVISRCEECHLEFVNPLPTIEFLNQLFNKEMTGIGYHGSYFEEYFKERSRRGKSYGKIYQSRLNLIEQFAGGKGTLLDIGCAAGFFLQYAIKQGWQGHGIDILPDWIPLAMENLNLKNVQCSALEDVRFANETFDVVTLWDLIEHLRHPMDCLRRINQLMKVGGHLAIWTPNVRNAVLLTDQWTGYWPRQHLYFFSLESLTALLQKAGFKTVFSKTNKSKKGLLIRQNSLTFQKIIKPEEKLERLIFSIKRDFKNAINPLTYLGPLLDQIGYGFNLFVIASKVENLKLESHKTISPNS